MVEIILKLKIDIILWFRNFWLIVYNSLLKLCFLVFFLLVKYDCYIVVLSKFLNESFEYIIVC